MALPLLLVGAAVLAGGAGVAAGVSAKGDFDEAERKNKKAKRIFKSAKKSLKQQRHRTQERLEDLGRQKVRLHQDGLKPFVDTFSRIKNVDYAGLTSGEDLNQDGFGTNGARAPRLGRSAQRPLMSLGEEAKPPPSRT